MLHVIYGKDDRASRETLATMFAARRSVFVDLLGWRLPVVDGRYEIDAFDDDHAVYLVLTDRDGRHLGSTRLLATSRPHILSGTYPHLCDGVPPCDPAVHEITRFCLDRRLPARDRRVVRDTLVAAIATHALENRIDAYVAVAEERWLAQIIGFGWTSRRLGPVVEEAGSRLGALRIEIERDTLGLLLARGIAAQPSLLRGERHAA